MNNLAEVCFAGLGVGGNYVRCFVIVVISLGLQRAEEWGRIESHNFEGVREQATKKEPVFKGGVDPSTHHEGGSNYVKLLFWKFCEILSKLL